MEPTLLCVLLLLNTHINSGHSEDDDGVAKAVLTIHPSSSQIFSGESVTLRCDIQGGGVTDWEYTWLTPSPDQCPQKEHECIISAAEFSHSGDYRCLGSHQQQDSKWSDAVRLTVTPLPKATLTVKPNPVFPGETVTLTCSVRSDSSWSYKWYKDRNDTVLPQSGRHTITGDTLTINGATVNEGPYWCQGKRESRPTSSSISDPVTIVVNALPRASVSISPQGPLYSGETVSLQCVIPDYTDWRYLWFRDNQHLPSQTSKVLDITIPITLTGQAGQYRCEGLRTDRPQRSQPSDDVTISVTDNRPTAMLSSDKEDVFTGDRVTLSCTVKSSGWKFYWYRHRPDSTPVTTTSGYSNTLSWVSVSDGGQFWCRAGRGDPVYYTLYSDPVQINITERPVAVLTLQPNWTQIFIRETVTMRCDIHGGGDSDWQYEWYKNSYSVYSNTKPEYRISPVYMSNRGSYTCEGGKGNKLSETSEAVQLTVSDQPKAVLSISPRWLNPGASVVLSCGVKELSTDWRFSWYRTVPTSTEQSYSFELLPDRGNLTTADSYTLLPAGPTPTGGYVCRAGRGDPVYDTLYSEPQFLWSGDLQPSASLTVNPNRTQHFRSTSLSLSCEPKGNSTGWRLKRYTETAWTSECPSTWRSITESTCTITSLDTWYSGVFWCESGSGEYSNAVNITVNDGDVILESPVHPVTEGDSVTLTCTFRYQETNPNLKTDFYKDGVLIKNETTGEMTIPTVSKSDEGFYKCKSGQGESPESWVTVRVPPGSVVSMSLPRLLCGLLVMSPFLLVSIVLTVKCCRARGLCSTVKSPQDQIPCDDVIEQN